MLTKKGCFCYWPAKGCSRVSNSSNKIVHCTRFPPTTKWRNYIQYGESDLTLCPSKCLPCHLSNGEGVVSRPSNWSGICKWVFWQKISRCLSPWWRRHRILTRFHPRCLRVGVCDPWTLRLDAQLGGILKDSRMKYKTKITKTTELAV